VGYQRLRRLLHLWSLSAVAAGQPVTTRSSRPYAPERLRRCRSPMRFRIGQSVSPRSEAGSDLTG
jgi:hypothetical protein